jgi:hypothetical protein
MRRIDGWRISKAVMNGWLPANDEWFKWEYQGPARITADRKYDSVVRINELNRGITTFQQTCAELGLYWQEVIDDAVAARVYLRDRCREAGVDPSEIQMLTPNGNLPGGRQAPGSEDNDDET